MTFNLATILRESIGVMPDKTLIIAGDLRVTYAEVDSMSDRVAAALVTLGFRPGDKIVVQLPNCPQFVYAYFGILKAGMVMVPLNPMLTAREIGYQLSDSDARLLITGDRTVASAIEAAHTVGGIELFVVSASGQPVPDGTAPFEDLLVAGRVAHLHQTGPDDTAVLLYTSGTTGKPKGAELTHFQLYMNCTVAADAFGASAADTHVAVLPLFHVFGLSNVLNMAVRSGGSLALIPQFGPEAVLTAIEQERCTHFFGVPTMYIALLQHEVGTRDLSSWRIAISGGASLPGEVMRAFEEKFAGVVILEGYGLSETAATSTLNISAQQRKILSIGKPIWGVSVKTVDHEGRELPPGREQFGEIVIQGHNVMKGYYKRPAETAAVMRDGWFHTGDIGYRDDDGFFFVVDRLKDLVIRGGYNIYPREVEEVLHEHPDVLEAAVVGQPDERLGERVVAYVALKSEAAANVADLEDHCRERLAPYKVPSDIQLVVSLPKGPTGKILKRHLGPNAARD